MYHCKHKHILKINQVSVQSFESKTEDGKHPYTGKLFLKYVKVTTYRNYEAIN